MKFFKRNGKIRVQVYPKVIEDKDRIKPAEQRIMEADNISPPILSDGAIIPTSMLPAHERIVKPEGNTPIYKEVRIDEEDKENK